MLSDQKKEKAKCSSWRHNFSFEINLIVLLLKSLILTCFQFFEISLYENFLSRLLKTKVFPLYKTKHIVHYSRKTYRQISTELNNSTIPKKEK